MQESMVNLDFSRPEIDPKKVQQFGPIDNDSEPLAGQDFITLEGSQKAMNCLTEKVLNKAFQKWGLTV